MPGANLSNTQKVLLILALIGLGYLFLQTQPQSVRVSTWRNRSGAVAQDSPGGSQQPPNSITGAAAPQTGRGPGGDANAPFGNPLQSPRAVLTQGYGVGSHAPAEIWGGVDLAIDGDGDGQADPKGTDGAPIYATHSGVARVRPDSWPAGNYLAIEGNGYKTAYAHLSRYAVEEGQLIERGQVIGYVGGTGQTSGPHLHYEVWKNNKNVNPLDYGALDGTDS